MHNLQKMKKLLEVDRFLILLVVYDLILGARFSKVIFMRINVAIYSGKLCLVQNRSSGFECVSRAILKLNFVSVVCLQTNFYTNENTRIAVFTVNFRTCSGPS